MRSRCRYTPWFVLRFLPLLLAGMWLTANPVEAQLAGTGAITGTVTDPSGAVVANATVTATDVTTNVKTVRQTTKAGDYNITPLIPDNYSVTVVAQGFQQYVQENIQVNALQTVSLSVKLTVGQASESVTVTSAPPTLETSDATLGGVMDNEVYAGLPLQMDAGGNSGQRRATDFEYLIPGVQANSTHNNNTDNSGIVNGSGPAGGVSDIYIEGVDLPEPDQVGDPRFTFADFSVDSVNQFQTLTAAYSAQYAGQGVENYSIKSGGNAYHGSIYEYFRNTVLDSWAFTSKVPTLTGAAIPPGGTCSLSALTASTSWCALGGIKPPEIENEYGIDLSGPILKDKLFLFYNYGQYRAQFGAKYQALTIPTAAMLGYTQSGTALGYADFSGYSAATGYNIYDPSTQVPGCSSCSRTQFMGMKNGVATPNVIPGSRISQAANYFNQFMLPYELLANQSEYANNITYGRPTGSSNWYQSGRIDYDQSQKNQISLIIGFGRDASTGTNQTGAGQLGPPFNTSQSVKPNSNITVIKDVFTINDHLVNQLAFGYGRYNSFSTTPNLAPQYSAGVSGLTNTPPGQATEGFPEIQFSGGVDNPGTQGGYSWNLKATNVYTVLDNVQWVFGRHNFTIGGQFVDAEFNYYAALTPSSPLNYTFAATQTAAFTTGTSINSTSGSAAASYMLGAASSGTTTADSPGLGSRYRTPSFWIQDDFKVDPKPPIRVNHNIFSFLNPTGQNSITGNLGTLEFAGSGPTSGLYCNCSNPSPTYYGNIEPRLGLAYSVDPKTVVRASYSFNYARGNWNSGSQSGSPSTLGFTPTAAAPAGISSAPAFYWDNTACAQNANDGVACGWTGSVVPPTPPAGGASLAEYDTGETNALGNSTATSSITLWNAHDGARTPQYINWTFGIQRQLARQMSISVSYAASEGHFISATQPWYNRDNKLPESMAALAGYTLASSTGTTATPCSGNNCPYPLLTQKATATNLALAQSLGFTPPNPYNPSNATYYSSNSVYQYYVGFPQYSGVSDTTSFVGNSNWNALEISLVQHHSYGLDVMLNYTYSKSIDDLGTFRVNDNPRLDRSLSTTDQPQTLASTVVYQSPFGRKGIGADNFWVRSIAGGWALSGIFTYHSGYPLAFTGSGCGGNSILNTCMPNIIPGQPGRINGQYARAANANTATTFSTVQYVNPAAFTVNAAGTSAQYGTSVNTNSSQVTYVGNGPALYVPGDAPRVDALNVWSMGTYNLDLGLRRTFPIHESWTFQFEADFLNATNHVVWSAPSAAVNSGSGFGEITSLANLPRDVQLTARINW
jgi:hypothetical protein